MQEEKHYIFRIYIATVNGLHVSCTNKSQTYSIGCNTNFYRCLCGVLLTDQRTNALHDIRAYVLSHAVARSYDSHEFDKKNKNKRGNKNNAKHGSPVVANRLSPRPCKRFSFGRQQGKFKTATYSVYSCG